MMSAQTIEEWADSRVQTFPLQHLSGAVIGVDASYYLDLRLNKQVPETRKDEASRDGVKRSLEPLFNALSGVPCCLQDAIERDVQSLKKQDISLMFVFNGLEYVTKEPSSARSAVNQQAHEEGWIAYTNEDPHATLKAFGKAGEKPDLLHTLPSLTRRDCAVESLYRWFQRLLQRLGVPFLVAPYGAAAQLAYLDKQPEQYIDAIMAPAECFLFGVEKAILDINPQSSTFKWLKKSDCQDLLDRASNNVFLDVQLLLGCSFLPTFPLLGRSPSGRATVREALGLLNSAGRNVIQLCQQFREDPQVMLLQYATRYKKATMTIRHHVVIEKNGNIGPMDYNHAPGDVHEFMGQRLPEELFFYISKGMMGAQIPTWLASSEVLLSLPAGAQDSEVYRRLVVEQLNPVRATTLKLISESMHRYYQSRTIKVSPWFEKDTTNLAIIIKEVPAVARQLDFWKIKSSDLPGRSEGSSATPTILGALRSLQDISSPAQNTSGTGAFPLTSGSDITVNVLWRFLQLRGYSDESHHLTSWGNALVAALEGLDSSNEAQEAGVLAVELLRLGLINGSDLNGSTSRGRDSAQYKISLLSRVACLGPLKSLEKDGYSGPLERSLLTFAWIVNAVRVSLRDLVETIQVCMFLTGSVSRDRSDWAELAVGLPFAIDNGCGLGVVTYTYLEQSEKAAEGKTPSDQLKDAVKKQGKLGDKKFDFFKYVDVAENLDTAFGLWDAVVAASKAAGKDFEDAKLFADVNEWLSARR